MRVLIAYNMHINETLATERVADGFLLKGYTVERLTGYRKHPFLDQSKEFLASMEEVKAVGDAFDLVIDLHGTVLVPRRVFGGRRPGFLYAATSCALITFDRKVQYLLAELISELLGQRRFLARLLGWTRRVRVVLDDFSAPAVQSVGLGRKYMKVEVFDIVDTIELLPKILKRIDKEELLKEL